MSIRPLRTLAAITLMLGAPFCVAGAANCIYRPASKLPKAAANDNRAFGGALRGGILQLNIVAREVAWYPDGPAGCALRVHAFGEEGKAVQIPGPMIRVRAGTEVRVNIRNTLSAPIWIRGLQDRVTSTIDSTEITPGATREFRFRATTPGAWYYWGGVLGKTAAGYPMSTDDGELVGALVVDPAEGPSHERVFVMTRWTPRGLPGNDDYQLNAINGRSWPYTERLAYSVGDSIRWHVINASDELHMMHLHGFYYRVDNRGDAAHDSVLARERRSNVVSVATRRGEWMSVTWSPDRSGNWLFHCHFVAHMTADQRLDQSGKSKTEHATHRATDDTAMRDMGGLLLGISIKPRAGSSAIPVATKSARRLQLFANMRPRVYGANPGYAFVLQEGDRVPARDSIRVPGTPLILTKGEPVAITVHNRTPTPIAVHWHGIELESFFDGVAGWSGAAKRLAPLIAPSDSFIARFTPPRAGTFMYHVHNEPGEQLASGLYAPLIVQEPGTRFDPRTDRIIVIASGGPGVDPPTAINGKLSPDTMQLVQGETYRFRIIDIASNEAHTFTLRAPTGNASWRQLARDGQDLPIDQQVVQPARVVTAAGVTLDYEFTPSEPGDYALDVTQILRSVPVGRVVVPIRVRVP
jgi:FtsP/CotA-like multicopper oxidase with cupredoxin domain